MLFFTQKKMSPLFFISRSGSPSPFLSLSFGGQPPPFSFSLRFSCSKFQNWGHDNISKLNTLDNLIQKQFSLFVFVFIDSLVVSALQDAGGYAISRQYNLELHLGCHTCWLNYFTLCACGADGRSLGRCTVTWLPNFLGWVLYHHFTTFSYPWCSAARFARGSSAIFVGQLHDDDIWLQLPEFISVLFCCLNLSIPLRIKEQ